MDEKIKIIDKICELHPSLGVIKGWSEYTGGMKDSGQWYFRKMLDVSIDELRLFIDSHKKDSYEISDKPIKSFEQSMKDFVTDVESELLLKLFKKPM